MVGILRKFSDLKPGQTFYYDNHWYLKTEEYRGNVNPKNYADYRFSVIINAVDMTTGNLESFRPEEEIEA